MSDSDNLTVGSIFDRALRTQCPAERDRFLAEACAGNDGVRSQVVRLLHAHEQAPTGFLDEVLPDTVSADDVTAGLRALQPEGAGERVGNYRLIEQIGEGGFGEVWRAEQERPIRRTVALKIIKLGMDTRKVIARFDQERQALALMDHPNIAKVFDAGATPTGRPYFAMEFVAGETLTKFCDEHRLSTSQRVQLFLEVCSAVQHAHQKGIIHRDLKPSNILVATRDGASSPKVIDFGVAKAMQERLSEFSFYTQAGELIGTPLYMSPEQAESGNDDVDTRSDVYALGVLLYELMVGKPPFHDEQKTPAKLRQSVCEQEASKPSTAIRSLSPQARRELADRRNTDETRLVNAVRGDLDCIVTKALEKDRGRRYQTVGALADDLERYLANEPVAARAPSPLYRLRKFARRNRLAVTAASVSAVAILAGLVTSTALFFREKATRLQASALLSELQASAPAFAAQARALATRQRFEEALEKLEYASKLRPDEPRYLLARADLLQSQLRLREAAEAYRAALRLRGVPARAQANADVCEKLLAEANDPQSLSRESLSRLLAHLQHEQRPASDLMLIAGRVGEQKRLVFNHWRERLKELPIGSERPVSDRLRLRDDGLLALDLSGTKITDLVALEGAPLGELDCTGCSAIRDLVPLRSAPLRSLRLAGTSVHDLSPLAECRDLEELDVAGTHATDFSALEALALRKLDLSRVKLSNLSALARLPLEELILDDTSVIDLRPLAKMPLKRLSAARIPAERFGVLSDLPLNSLNLRFTKFRDLAVLAKMPLEELFLTGCRTANFEVLPELRALKTLAVPENFSDTGEVVLAALKKSPNLRQIGLEPGENRSDEPLPVAAHFWSAWDLQATAMQRFTAAGWKVTMKTLPDGSWEVAAENQPISDLLPLEGLPISRLSLAVTKVSDIALLRRLPLKALSLRHTRVEDIRPLAGMKLEQLDLGQTLIRDIAVLQGMPLTVLSIEGTIVSDLSPLRGMPLQELWASAIPVVDLSPLKGLPLQQLLLEDCREIRDVSAILEIPRLQKLVVPRGPANLEVLRQHPRLQYLAFKFNFPVNLPDGTAEEFWATSAQPNAGMVATLAELARAGRFAELAKLLQVRLEQRTSPEEWKERMCLAAVALKLRDTQQYTEIVSRMFERDKLTFPTCVLKVASLRAESPVSAKEIEELLRQVEANSRDREANSGDAFASMLGKYRLGRWSEAAAVASVILYERRATQAAAYAVAAMARLRLGDTNGSRADLASALICLQKEAAEFDPNAERWHDVLIAELLIDEAEQLAAAAAKTAAR